VVDVAPAKGCSAPIQPTGPTRVVAAPTTFSPFLMESVSVAGAARSVTAVVATPLDGGRLRGWLKDIGVGAGMDLAVACPEGTTASTASGQRDGQLRTLALSRLAGGRASLPDSSLEVAAAGTGHPCVVIAAAPSGGGVAAPGLLFTLLGLALALGASMVWWLGKSSYPTVFSCPATVLAASTNRWWPLPAWSCGPCVARFSRFARRDLRALSGAVRLGSYIGPGVHTPGPTPPKPATPDAWPRIAATQRSVPLPRMDEGNASFDAPIPVNPAGGAYVEKGVSI